MAKAKTTPPRNRLRADSKAPIVTMPIGELVGMKTGNQAGDLWIDLTFRWKLDSGILAVRDVLGRLLEFGSPVRVTISPTKADRQAALGETADDE